MKTALIPVAISANLPPHTALAPSAETLPLFLPDERVEKRFAEILTVLSAIKIPVAAYLIAARSFTAWCGKGTGDLREVEPIHVAAYVEQLETSASSPPPNNICCPAHAVRLVGRWQVPPSSPSTTTVTRKWP